LLQEELTRPLFGRFCEGVFDGYVSREDLEEAVHQSGVELLALLIFDFGEYVIDGPGVFIDPGRAEGIEDIRKAHDAGR
jgi:hypothetical protein